MRRILTAVLLIPAVVWLVLWGPPYLLVTAQVLVTMTALWEYYRLADAAIGVKTIHSLGYAAGLIVALLSLSNFTTAGIVGATVLLLMIAAAVAMLSQQTMDYLKSISATILGVVYVAIPLTLLTWVCLQQNGSYWTLFAMVVIWSGDTAGFFVGRAFGKHKLSPLISPNKTWEGTTASFIAACLVGLLASRYLPASGRHWEVAVLAGLINVAGQFGDLAESAMKRNAGVKDSSHLVPGHGGVLDRIDALLFAAPVLWYYWLFKSDLLVIR